MRCIMAKKGMNTYAHLRNASTSAAYLKICSRGLYTADGPSHRVDEMYVPLKAEQYPTSVKIIGFENLRCN